MKYLLLFMISIYQLIFSPLLRQLLGQNFACRYTITCSVYAKDKISTHGLIIGTYLAVKRILSCQPYLLKKTNYVH